MHLSQLTIHGFRAASDTPFTVTLPGRFSVIAGANSGGKSTISDAIVLSHHDVFPFVPRPSSAVLSQTVATRSIEVTYDLPASDFSPLGALLSAQSSVPKWTTTLSSSMGRVSASSDQELRDGQLPVMYLSPTRNPAIDLAGREAHLIVELLKSQGLRDRGDKSLRELRGLLQGLIGSVVSSWPIDAAEARVGTLLGNLTEGVSGRVPYLGTTRIDDTFLARVFEFLIATAGTDRRSARRLETEGLGYSNLLELAVVLAAIPDLTRAASPEATSTGAGGEPTTPDDEPDSDDERVSEMQDAEANAALEGETFFAGNFHATVLLEEPEAHLHPQLQHGLVTYLKEVVQDRPEVQVIITTHSDQIVGACEPNDLVICARSSDGPVARTVQQFGLNGRHHALARRHLDATRSASLFAERAVLVEGVTDATVLRAFGRVWADGDVSRKRFIDALTITVVGSRVGPWLYRLLVNPDHPISRRLAVLSDSDGKPPAKWIPTAVSMADGRFDVFSSEPTLEPSLVPGNEQMFHEIFDPKSPKSRPFPDGGSPTISNVTEFFKKGGRSRKADFADDVAAFCDEHPDQVEVPSHMKRLLEFLWLDDSAASSEGDPETEAP